MKEPSVMNAPSADTPAAATSLAAPRVRVRSVELFERPVTLRLPFRFGAATVTRCPQAFVRVHSEVAGRPAQGATAELMVPKWFDKSPQLTHEQNFEQLREALRLARAAALAAGEAAHAWALSQAVAADAMAAGLARGLPRLAAQFGPALIDKAVADAVLRASGASWCEGVAGGLLGDPWGRPLAAQGALRKPRQVWLRHTVGLADRLTPGDPGADPGDGLPATLSDAIAHYGLRWFKLKLCGRADEDFDRLGRIASVLAHVPDWRVTLDGNETFTDAQALGAFWAQLREGAARTQPLHELLQRTVLLEQPLPRHLALSQSIDSLGIDVPVILDESDDDASVLDRGLALGYRGISSKACKGIYRSLHSAARIAMQPQLLLSGEDLTCQAGLAVQQDSLLAASLGVTHIERNGHHYVDGFGVAPPSESAAFAQACPDLYTASGQGARLAVRDGLINLGNLHGAGFASPAQPQWDSLTPIH